MITVPAMRLHQFGVEFYQAILGVSDVQKLVRFEVLSYTGDGRTAGKRPVKAGRAGKINWDVLESKIAHSEEAYQRPLIQKKIAELMDYYVQCSESGSLPAVPGAVLLTSERRLEFVPVSSHRILGVLQLPPESGSLRALDGQHRLLAIHQLAEQRPLENVQVPAIIFDRLTPDQVVELFVTINAKHTKLNPSHLISLSGRRLYPDKALAASHDIIRVLSENKDSPLHGDIKLFGVGHGRVAQAPLADELKGVFTALDAFGGRQAEVFHENAPRFFLTYFKQIARVFNKAWSSKRYSIKTATALRAFLRLVPDVLSTIRHNGGDPYEAASIHDAIAPWHEYVGDARFETEGEWRMKQAGGTRGTVDVLARELRSALRT
ncbi:MAG: DGQHR domain-containing protein [Deltaproteobacteria bacterium]|nr:DGQHR domain-containing protein [Deltaproteobacteria bacterium]MBI3386178.1 DGQHR domain-containing protein [Deltaproteobacteria bacterium]